MSRHNDRFRIERLEERIAQTSSGFIHGAFLGGAIQSEGTAAIGDGHVDNVHDNTIGENNTVSVRVGSLAEVHSGTGE